MSDGTIQPDRLSNPQTNKLSLIAGEKAEPVKLAQVAGKEDTFNETANAKAITNVQIQDEAKRIAQDDQLNLFYRFVNYDLKKIEYFPAETQNKIKQAADSMTPVVKEISFARAKVNLTKDLSAFNKYLPYRNSIKNNPEKLKQYDELVNLIVKKADMRLVESDKLHAFDGFPKADLSTSYMFASLIVEVYHNKPELVKKVLDRDVYKDRNFKVSFRVDTLPFGSGSVGYNNMISIAVPMMWYKVAFKPSRDNIPAHEFTHSVEASKGGRDHSFFTDGILEEMDKMQDAKGKSLLTRYIAIRDRLYELSELRRLPVRERSTRIMAYKEDKATGLTSYTYSDEKEFLAESISMFYNAPQRFFSDTGNKEINESKAELYSILSQFFQLDPLKDLQH